MDWRICERNYFLNIAYLLMEDMYVGVAWRLSCILKSVDVIDCFVYSVFKRNQQLKLKMTLIGIPNPRRFHGFWLREMKKPNYLNRMVYNVREGIGRRAQLIAAIDRLYLCSLLQCSDVRFKGPFPIHFLPFAYGALSCPSINKILSKISLLFTYRFS